MAVIRTKRINQGQQRMSRVRSKIKNTTRPRLSVYRSNTSIYAQVIDDATHRTLAAASSQGKKVSGKEAARAVGAEIAQKAAALGVTEVVFDRGGYSYKGNIQELADAARSAGLTF